jgi:hypothetical protein
VLLSDSHLFDSILRFLSDTDTSCYDDEPMKSDVRMDRIADVNLENKINDAIAGRKGIMLVSSGKMPQFTVSRCTDTQIFQARHARASELNPSADRIYVRLDAAQRGLGTGSCGTSIKFLVFVRTLYHSDQFRLSTCRRSKYLSLPSLAGFRATNAQ